VQCGRSVLPLGKIIDAKSAKCVPTTEVLNTNQAQEEYSCA